MSADDRAAESSETKAPDTTASAVESADTKASDVKRSATEADDRPLLDRLWMPATPALRLATLRALVGTYGFVYVLVRLPHLLSYALALRRPAPAAGRRRA